MKKFILTFKTTEGKIDFYFNEDGLLIYFSNEAELSTEQHRWILMNLPFHFSDLEVFSKQKERFTVTKNDEPIPFEKFWTKYDHKSVSNKLLSQKVWNKLCPADQSKVITDIPRYANRLIQQPGVPKKYAETYLRSRVWDR